MRTEQLYLLDPYQKTMQAKILEILPEARRKLRVVLDRSVFYAMTAGGGGSRGGPPSDQGWLSLASTSPATKETASPDFKITKVELKDGEVWHYLESLHLSELRPIAVGEAVSGSLDWEKRYSVMRLSTTGIAFHFALHRLGLFPAQLKPLRGGFGSPAYMVYECLNPSGFTEQDTLEQLQPELIQLLDGEVEVISHYYSSLATIPQLTTEIYREVELGSEPEFVQIIFENIGSIVLGKAAGGFPLLRNTREIGRMEIISIEQTGEQLKINFRLSE